MHNTRDTFEDLPILTELRSSLGEAFSNSDLRQPAARRRNWKRTSGIATVPRRRSRRLALTAGAVVSLVAAGLFGFQGASNPPSALAAQMNRLAQVAASQGWSGLPGLGQYLYTDSESAFVDPSSSGTTCVAQLDHLQRWIGSDNSSLSGDGFIYQSKFTSPAGVANCVSIGIQNASQLHSAEIVKQGPPKGPFPTTLAAWQSLGTDPAKLLQKVHQLDGGDNTPAEEFVNVSDFLKAVPVPLASLQALYQAVALIPGVRLMGAQTDVVGQAGIGVEIASNTGYTSRMIFDQQTGRLLATENYDASGTLVQAEEYVTQKIVDSAPPTS